jgi:hypothetical protein
LKGKKAKLAGTTTARMMEGMLETEHGDLKALLDLLFVTDEEQKSLIIAKLINDSRIKLIIFEQLKSGDYHAAEETINTQLLT